MSTMPKSASLLSQDLKQLEETFPLKRLTDFKDPHFDGSDEGFRKIIVATNAWRSLAPFFLMHGYTIYGEGRNQLLLIPEPEPELQVPLEYPYAYREYESALNGEFFLISPSTYPARDSKGRDVVFKVVSDGIKSDELRVLEYLNSKEARSDPHNRTIPVIEFLKFSNFTFVVMPRWDFGLNHAFERVKDLMFYGQQFLEAFEFLHRNRVVHFDFITENTAINSVAPQSSSTDCAVIRGLRDPSKARYALIDFGYSKIYPRDVDVDTALETEAHYFDNLKLSDGEAPYNPFWAEMYSVGKELQRYIRGIEPLVPELGPFFDTMVANGPWAKGSSAEEALRRFNVIYSNIPKEVLDTKIKHTLWGFQGSYHPPEAPPSP